MGQDRNEFDNKVIALTGGASGIGLATSQTLLSRGASIAIGDIDDAAIEQAKKSFSSGTENRVMFTKLDVSDRASVDAWIKAVVERFGRLDGAANCAGVIGRHHGTRKLEEQDDDQWDLIMRVNLTGMMYCMRAQLQNMPGPGSIVCVSSVQGTLGFAKHAAYAASKHGVLGLVRSAAKEVGERNIRVNVVTPGSIQTPLMDKRNALEGVDQSNVETPINRIGTPEEVGKLIVWLLSEEATFVSGATYAVDGGWAC